MKTFLRSCLAIIVLIVIVYFVTNYAGVIQQKIGMKGANSNRGQQIVGQIKSDLQSAYNAAEQQFMHTNFSELLSSASRFQKIPRDFNNLKGYAQTQIQNMLQSKQKK